LRFACKIIPDLAVKRTAFLLRVGDISGTHFGPGNDYAFLNI